MKTSVAGGLAASATVALLFGGGAVASAKTYKATAPIEHENESCGQDIKSKVIGSVKFQRTGNIVSLKVNMTDAAPRATFYVSLYGNGCAEIGVVTKLKTNSKGKGKASGKIEVPEADTEFFADPDLGENFSDDTPYVSLP